MPKESPAGGDLQPLLSIEDLAPYVRGATKPTIYKWIAKGQFPRPIRIAPCTAAWIRSEVEAWQRRAIEERDASAGLPQTPGTLAAKKKNTKQAAREVA